MLVSRNGFLRGVIGLCVFIGFPLAAVTTSAQEITIPLPEREEVTTHLDEVTQQVTYEIEANAADIVTFFTELADGSDNFSLLMTLIDPNGNELKTEDTRRAYFFNWSLGPYTLPTDGTYTLQISKINPEHTLTINTYWLKRQPPILQPDQEIGESLHPEVVELPFVVEASAGDRIIAFVRSDVFDPVLTLKNPSGEEIAFDDDSWGNLNARIGPIELREAGQYQLIVTANSRSAFGRFEISYRIVSDNLLQYFDSRTVELSDEPMTFVFDGVAGEVVALDLEYDGETILPAEISTNLVNQLVATNNYEENAISYDLSHIPLPRTGLYTIQITPVSGIHHGNLHIALEKIADHFIPDRGLYVHLSSKNPTVTLQYDPDPGVDQRLIFEQWGELSTEAVPFTIRLLQNDQTLASYSAQINNIRTTNISFVFRPYTVDRVTLELETAAANPVMYYIRFEYLYGEG